MKTSFESGKEEISITTSDGLPFYMRLPACLSDPNRQTPNQSLIAIIASMKLIHIKNKSE